MSQVSTAVALRDEGATALVEAYKNDLASIMPSHMKPDVFVRLAVSVLSRDPNLLRAAQANPLSLMSALWEASRKGLEPGTEQFYLTSRTTKNGPEILGVTGYQGEIEMIYRAGAAASVTVEVVRQKDVFVWRKGSLDTHRPPRWDGPQRMPYHDIDWDVEDRGLLRLVYAYADMKSGSISKVVVLNKAHIAKAKQFSAGSSKDWSPWVQHEESMWMKTAAHRLAKWVPTSAEDLTVSQVLDGGRPSIPFGRQPDPATDFQVMADEADTLDELSTALGRAQAAGYAVVGDDLFRYFVARRAQIEAAEADEIVDAHLHEDDYDPTCAVCQADQAEADRKLAAAAA